MAARQYRSTVEAKTLQSAINNSVGSMTLNSITSLPNSYPYTLVVDTDLATEEIVTVTASAGGNSLTITRGQDGTSAQSHDAGAVVKHMITARDLQEPQDHINANSAVHGVTGSVVGTSDAQVLTNKTIGLTTNTLTGTTAQFNTALSDNNFATQAGTETLTNKTLTSPVVTGGTLNGGAALTVDSTELNILDGVTASTAELNILDGVIASTTELNYVDGVTSAIQTQLNTNTPVGSITMWAGAAASPPTGWLVCNGQSTTGYTALAAIVGATVPDMQGLVPVGWKSGDDSFGTLKGTGGSKTSTAAHTHSLASHTHTINHDHGAFTSGDDSPDHSHTAVFYDTASNQGDSAGGQFDTGSDQPTAERYIPTTGASARHQHSIDVPNFGGSSGGPSDNTSGASSVGATNGNLQPYFTINFIIKH